MSGKKVIAVVGATGAQGGGLARAILDDPQGEFALRAITRNTDSAAARALAARGAEVVAADLDDPASLDRAFAGAHGAFCVTFFWAHFSPERELAEAGAMADAAKRAGVRHVVWSTLEDTRKWVPLSDPRMPTLQGKYKVPHFDAKGEADQLFLDRGVPTTCMLTCFYWDNLLTIMAPRPGPDGVLGITFPIGESKMSGIASEDIGRCAYGIFARGESLIGQTVGIAGEHLTGAELAAGLGAALGREVRYNAVTPDVYRGFGFPGADDLGNMFQFYRDFAEGFTARRNLAEARALNPSLQTFAQWTAANKAQLIAAVAVP